MEAGPSWAPRPSGARAEAGGGTPRRGETDPPLGGARPGEDPATGRAGESVGRSGDGRSEPVAAEYAV